ncbi:hypothetical protein B0H14DRAFT_3458698 [Mycena olivaceomarginata]|nr:hypothetical protein B0H14DRAFT_3458698 [Mycena olivaceomarginata]
MLQSLALSLLSAGRWSLEAQLVHAGHIKELNQDLVALGVGDAELCHTLDVTWKITLYALTNVWSSITSTPGSTL